MTLLNYHCIITIDMIYTNNKNPLEQCLLYKRYGGSHEKTNCSNFCSFSVVIQLCGL